MFTEGGYLKSRYTNRLIVTVLLVITAGFLIYAEAGESAVSPSAVVVSLDISDNGGAVTVNKRDMLEISLLDDHTDGYQWMLDTASLNPDIVSQINASDADNYNRWLFQTNQAGTSNIKLNYRNILDNDISGSFQTTVTVTADPNERPSPFSLIVQPVKMNDVIVGQKCVYLVKVVDEGEGYGKGEPVNLSAMSLLSETTVAVEPNAVVPGQVAEVTVIPAGPRQEEPRDPNVILSDVNNREDDPNAINPEDYFEYEEAVVVLTAERNGVQREIYLYLNVYPGEDWLEQTAAEYRDKFIPYLATNYPELGITEETVWQGTVVKPRILVVTYYLFFSEQWEMGIRWHVMIPPYDWAEIYLRKRGEDLGSTYAFKISSVAGQTEPQIVDLPPESIWR